MLRLRLPARGGWLSGRGGRRLVRVVEDRLVSDVAAITGDTGERSLGLERALCRCR